MALRRRILSPDDGNYTVGYVCVNCNVTCFGDLCIPVAAPPPVGLNFTDGDATPIALNHKSRLLPNLLFAGAALLAASFIVLLATYAFHRLRRRRRRMGPSPAAPLAPPGVDGDDDDDGFFEDGEADHHVWHIRTVGLDEATIRSIAACVYNSKDGLLNDSADCAVCLAELRDQELLRLLPKCGHAFHLPCIDTWLRSHVSCPLCRAPILAPASATDPENPALSSSPPINTVDSGIASTALVENTQIAIGLESVQTDPEEGIGSGVDPAAASSSTPSSSKLLGNGVEDGLQPVRRSVSMDSSSLAALLLRAEPEENSGEEKKEPHVGEHLVIKIRGNQMNAGKGTGLPKGPIRMGRSLSSRSGRFFLSRYGRARNSVLPL